ncbi:MAG TPA: hypothetical protein VF119_00150 [Candidatus Limnocylindrales bacterium]
MDRRAVPDGERVVALTDLALGIEATVLAAGLALGGRGRPSRLRGPLVVSFAATAVASLAGAALHGLFADRTDPRRSALWRTSLASIGMAALASWWLGARLALQARTAAVVSAIATVAHLPYLASVLTGDRRFFVAILAYLPGVAFLSGALLAHRRDPAGRMDADAALAAIGVTLAAAVVQVRHVGFGPRFDHNALYHSLQAVGTGLFFVAARGLLAREGQAGGRH